nr:hypothetical protein Itr_chr15CG08310 [Ipomoea trifida]
MAIQEYKEICCFLNAFPKFVLNAMSLQAGHWNQYYNKFCLLPSSGSSFLHPVPSLETSKPGTTRYELQVTASNQFQKLESIILDSVKTIGSSE